MNKHTNASAGMLVVYARYRRSFAQLRERHHGVERAGWGASGHARSQAVAGAMSPASTWSSGRIVAGQRQHSASKVASERTTRGMRFGMVGDERVVDQWLSGPFAPWAGRVA